MSRRRPHKYFSVMAGEDVLVVDKGNVLLKRVLDPFVKTETKADVIETALLPRVH